MNSLSEEMRNTINIVEYRGDIVTAKTQLPDNPSPKHWVDQLSSEMMTNSIFSENYIESKIADMASKK